MYYPTQIPYVLDQEFSQSMKYTEEPAASCGGFVICFWEIRPFSNNKTSARNVIAADGCIDLVVNYDEKTIGFAGMSKTVFDFRQDLSARFFGARMMPGAFFQLTGLPASAVMDSFLPIKMAFKDFDESRFFALPFARAREYFKHYLARKTEDKKPDKFTSLFCLLSGDPPATAKELYEILHVSPRQCQRVFAKHYGITPKMVLSIIRFQKCLKILTSPKASAAAILNATNYYDQPHFINDFKRNIGLTPQELIAKYQS